MRTADFRSDTVTRPTPEMRAAIAAAEVGDDVLDGDPTVRRLEERAAEWLGKEHALFVPSGTMANQVAVGSWTRPGDEVICERRAHVLSFESGALGAVQGVQTQTLWGEGGALDPAEVAAAVRPDFVHCPRTALICVEETHMGSGGRVVPLENLRAVHAVAAERGIPVHMDGARLANASVAAGLPARELAACAESVSLCLSKGLGAPVGSVVAGDGDFRERALRVRKRLGGWMRQSGLLAAAGLIALEEGPKRLAEDHALARDLAVRVDRFPGLSAPVGEVETNLVLVRVERDDLDAATLAVRLDEEGVRVMALGPGTLRFVTHRDVGPQDVALLESALERILGA